MRKRCATCKIEKEILDFRRSRKSRDGRQWECKLCANIRVKEYYSRPETKARKQAYAQLPEVVARRREREGTPEYEAKRREYRNRPDVASRIQAYNQLPHVKAAKRYRNQRNNNFPHSLIEIALTIQHSTCAICRTPFEQLESRYLHADHCHKTQTPRGLLCHKCNTAIGLLGDDPDRLRAAADYLEDPPLSLIV